MELIDLYKAFNMLNAQVFHGELKTPELSWNTRCYRTFGRCYTYSAKIEIMTCQRVGGRDSYSYLNTLCHELIHLWLNTHGCRNAGHDARFQAIAKYCNGLGFNIHTHSTFDAEKNVRENHCGAYSFDGLHLYYYGRLYV